MARVYWGKNGKPTVIHPDSLVEPLQLLKKAIARIKKAIGNDGADSQCMELIKIEEMYKSLPKNIKKDHPDFEKLEERLIEFL